MADENSLWRDRNKVFVAGIPAHADDAALYEKFRKFGEMHQSKVVFDARTGKSKGFGFLTFASYEHALEAVDNMNQSKWENRVLNVRFLQPKSESGGADAASGAPAATAAARQRPAKIFPPCPEGCTSVYVGNLAYGITEPVLRKVFAGCGDIKAVRFAEHIETKEFRGFGYVQFYDGAACEKAVRLDGMIVMGRPMNLDYGARDEATEKAREDLTRKLKKGVCHRFQSGECPRGDDCKFAHVLSAQDAERVLHSEPTSAVAAATPAVPAFSASASLPAPADGPPICESFLKGKCKRGDKCKFLHVEASAAVPVAEAAAVVPAPVAEFRSRYAPSSAPAQENETPVCQSFLQGKCKRGDKCKFRHEEEQEGDAASTPTAVENLYYESRAPQEEETVDDGATVCQSFLKGKCKRGDKCRFSHVDPATVASAPARVPMPVRAPVPVRGPTSSRTAATDASDVPVCLNFQKGTCTRGDACRFRHVAATEAPPVPVAAAVAAPAAANVPAAPAVHVTAAAEDAPICQSFLQGRCKRGEKCRFRHVDAADVPAVATPEVVPTISICKNFTRGRCARGTSCRFAHTDGDVADAAAAREAAAVVAAAAVTTAHSDYQKRFQSVCYNWQNARSCVRGDACPFFHDGAVAPPSKAPAPVARREDDVDQEMEATKEKKEKKEKREKKEKKEKKNKKRKAEDSDDDDDSDSDDDKKKKKKKKKKTSKRSESE